MKGLKFKWHAGTWCVSTDFFGTEISSFACTLGRAHFNLQRMYDERLAAIIKAVWEAKL